MEIGTANVSAIVGSYSHPVAMTTDKFSVPYFVTTTTDARQPLRHQLNVVDILPLDVDLVTVSLDLVRVAQWTSVAVVSQQEHGNLLTMHCISNASVPSERLCCR